MKNEGNVAAAREYFLTGKNRVLYHLVEQRFSWMNKYIRSLDRVVLELGCGAGLSREFISNRYLVLTDVVKNEWVDRQMDALNMDVEDESLDVIICSHMIHHIAKPTEFLEKAGKKLKPGGRIIIQEIYTGTLMKLVLRIMCHEGWSELVDVYNRDSVCNEASDPWSANCAIPKLLFFRGGKRFLREFPVYRILKRQRNECLLFLLSGGVIAKTFYLPVGDRTVKLIRMMDRVLVHVAPEFFACGCSVVLEKTDSEGQL